MAGNKTTAKDIMRFLTELVYGDKDWENLEPSNTIRVSSQRYAETINTIRKYLDGKRMRILDFGTRQGFMSLLVKHFFPYHFVLASDIQIKEEVGNLLKRNKIQIKENVVFRGGESLPFDSCSFDAVLFLEVLEHIIDNPTHVISELHRILRPDGFLFLTTPNIAHVYNRIKLLFGKQPQLFLTSLHHGKKAPRGHFREWTMDELMDLVTDLFEIVEAKYVKAVDRYGMISEKLGLEILYYPYCLICTIKPSLRNQIAVVAKARNR